MFRTASHWLDGDHVALGTAGSKQCSECLVPLCGVLGVPSTHIVNFSAGHTGSGIILVQQNLFPY